MSKQITKQTINPILEVQKQEKFEYSYNGDIESIDINTLLLSQIHFLTIVNEVQRELFPELQLKIKVEAPKRGSFIFISIFEWLKESNLFSKDNLEYVNAAWDVGVKIVTAIGGIYYLYKLLKGKKPDKEERKDTNVIITINGNVYIIDQTVYGLYKSNPTINLAVNKQFEALEGDENVDGISIIKSETAEKLINIEREEFIDLTLRNQLLEGETIEKPKSSSVVFIKKPDLFPKKEKVSWDLIYEGRNIKAIILDKGFIEKINNGLRIGQGDSMVVDLNIIAEFDSRFNTHIDKSYEIKKVYDVLPKPEQKQIDFNDKTE
jgi:hypothetical protein